jgi:flavin-binding protein dodecin
MTEVGLLSFARIAPQVCRAVLLRYRSRFSKHQFTQPHLLAILCLMRYENWTFREAEWRLGVDATALSPPSFDREPAQFGQAQALGSCAGPFAAHADAPGLAARLERQSGPLETSLSFREDVNSARLLQVSGRSLRQSESALEMFSRTTVPSRTRQNAAGGKAPLSAIFVRHMPSFSDAFRYIYLALDKEAAMPQKVIEIVGSSKESFAKAADNAVAEAAKTVRGLKWARVSELEMHLDDKKIVEYLATTRIYFDVKR